MHICRAVPHPMPDFQCSSLHDIADYLFNGFGSGKNAEILSGYVGHYSIWSGHNILYHYFLGELAGLAIVFLSGRRISVVRTAEGILYLLKLFSLSKVFHGL
jgi:hypothetical protein